MLPSHNQRNYMSLSPGSSQLQHHLVEEGDSIAGIALEGLDVLRKGLIVARVCITHLAMVKSLLGLPFLYAKQRRLQPTRTYVHPCQTS